MAVLDPRLLDLIDTLVRSRLDWLAFELIEGLQAGRAAEESEEALAAARESIQKNDQPKARGEPQTLVSEPQPIEGDEQIDWAAAYVERRLDAALVQLAASTETLEFIVAGTTADPTTGKPFEEDGARKELRVVPVILANDGYRQSKEEDVAAAREAFPTLRASLAEWTVKARGSTAS